MKRMTQAITNMKSTMDRARWAALDVLSVIAKGGKTANTETFSRSELRDLKIMLPYGISASGLDDIRVQVILNGSDATIVGVYDPKRPDVESGEIIVYSNFGSKIILNKDGNVVFETAEGKRITMDDLQTNKLTVGTGAKGVARVGDSVSVNVPGYGACTGTITSGSSVAKID